MRRVRESRYHERTALLCYDYRERERIRRYRRILHFTESAAKYDVE